ncbi:uncharacterized protein LOC133791850 [Humulus lupulus]|uniref:uncharacterized protein LOC133791850 n=1 Tax=Humulus lupulus TaxID=3486 RepID=UPI002B410F59|nr:uncharacterized protein LOC133791850 [Humulus lupulus]
MDGKQQIEHIFSKKNIKDRISYCVRLIASDDCIRFLVRQGLAFRGQDESQESNNQGNFLELLTFLANHNEEVRLVALKNAPENLKLASSKIQKDIEQMIVMFRYVDKRGCVIERFISIEHVPNTIAISLKIAIDKFFSKHRLSISKLRGQGYDGASNMSGEFNGLKSIVMKENECAFFVHCFAHQLQLALLSVAKKHDLIGTFLTVVSNVVNVFGASSKRHDILREKQALKVIKALKGGELLSGRSQNQEMIDLQLQELNSRFNEANTELLLCLACLTLANSFSAFDKGKLICLAQLYPCDFSTMDIKLLEYQLQTYVDDMRSHVKFSALKGMVDLSKKLVETQKDKVYQLVYLLIKLALTLPVATTSVERAFSVMNIVNHQMHNKIRDQWLNDSLTVYLENDVFNAIDNEPIIHRFQNMKSHRGQL